MKLLAVFFLFVPTISTFAQCVAPAFKAPIPNGIEVLDPRVVDFNGDGIPDLVTGGQVLLGRGDGTFDPPIALSPAGSSPLVADVNNDGRPDLIVGFGDAVLQCSGGSMGGVFLSSPNGVYSIGRGFWGAGTDLVSDWDGDGNLDLLVGWGVEGDCAIAVRRGDGDGTFGDAIPIFNDSIEIPPSTAVLADFDGDGLQDLAYRVWLTDTRIAARLLRHRPDAGLEPFASFEMATDVIGEGRLFAGDLNNDGRPDLLCQMTKSVTAFLNRGGGEFESVLSPLAHELGAAWDFAIADFNGDGLLDIALLIARVTAGGTGTSSFIGFYVGDGRGRFSPGGTFPLGPFLSRWLLAADFNNDGRPDIAIDGDSSGFFVLLNDCQPNGRLVSIVPTVASASGLHGSFFRTRLEIQNPCTGTIEGRLVFHARGRVGTDGDPRLSFALDANETLRFDDVVSNMGESGSGALDVFVTGTRAPNVSAEVFNSSAGAVKGGTEEAVSVDQVFHVGEAGQLTAPADLSRYRFAVGLRTLGEGVSLRVTVRSGDGAVLKVVHRSFGPNRSIQEPAEEFLLGFALSGHETVSLSLLSGSAVLFGTTADNATSTPTIQVPRR